MRDVPVDGFWSISVYNADGFFEPNDRSAYSVNNLTATPNADGSVTVHFGGERRPPEPAPDHGGLELHRAPVPAQAGSPRRLLDVPGDRARLIRRRGRARLTLRELNRATPARQLPLERKRLGLHRLTGSS